jgi:hypothetical protein
MSLRSSGLRSLDSRLRGNERNTLLALETGWGALRYSERLTETGVEAPFGGAAVRPELP